MKGSWINLNKEALANNIAFIRKQLKKDVKLSSVIKGNAYGHGIKQMVPELEVLGVDHFSVFSVEEAKIVSSIASKQATIMVMGHIPQNDYEWVVKNNIECFVFNFERLKSLQTIAEKLDKEANIHIEVETGMNRTGFESKDWLQLLQNIQSSPYLCLKGVCTHFAGAESISNYLRIQHQRKTFKKFNQLLKQFDLEPTYRHTSCSAALISYPNEQWDLVRVGILQYGLWPSKETYISYLTRKKLRIDPLKRVISWKTNIMNIKEVKKDQFIGYGISLLAEQDMKIAAIPVGYSDGYSRALSNQGKVIVHGVRLDVIGIINMNMFLIDITSLPNINIGDEVTLIGEENDIAISVASFGDLSNQLNYELLTRLDKNIPRKFI